MAKVLSDNAITIVNFLRGIADATANDIAEATGMGVRSVTGTVNGLVKKGLAERFEVEGEDKKHIRITPAGVEFDVNAEK